MSKRRTAERAAETKREAEREARWYETAHLVPAEVREVGRWQRGEYGEETPLADVLGNVSAAGFGVGRGPFGGGIGQIVTEAMTPLAPPEMTAPIKRIPVVGELAERYAAGITSPAGLAFLSRFPAMTVAGTLGAVGAGTAGRGLERLGAPKVDVGPITVGPGGVGELVGGLATPGMLTTPGRAAVGLVGREGKAAFLEATARVKPATREFLEATKRVATEEAGALRIGGRVRVPVTHLGEGAERIEEGTIRSLGKSHASVELADGKVVTAEIARLEEAAQAPRVTPPEGAVPEPTRAEVLAQEKGTILTNDIPPRAEIDSRLRETANKLGTPRVRGKAELEREFATLKAQQDIDNIRRQGLTFDEQMQTVMDERLAVETELRRRAIPFGGAASMRGKTARATAARLAATRNDYPGLTTAQLDVRQRVFQEFEDNFGFRPGTLKPLGGKAPEEPLVGRARFTEAGEVLQEPTYATEAELGGIRPTQGRMGIGAGERPIETVGPMFAREQPAPPLTPAAGPLRAGLAPDLDTAVNMARKLNYERPIYITPTYRGLAVTDVLPAPGTSYHIVRPGGVVETVSTVEGVAATNPLLTLPREVAEAGKNAEFARNVLVSAKQKLGTTAGRGIIRAKGNNAFLERAGLQARVDDVDKVVQAALGEGLATDDIVAAARKAGVTKALPTTGVRAGAAPPSARPPSAGGFAEYEAAGAEERILGGLRGGEPPGRKPSTAVGGDLPPLEPEPKAPKLPTMRDVEARSKPLPPEVRAELGGQPPAMRFELEPFETVSQRWGDRFVENWWTKAEDLLGGKISAVARTPEEIAVRRAFIKRDIYAATQGDSMRFGVLEWLGRNRKVLGINGRGQAKAVQVAPGAEIPKGLEQHLMHIVEHPEKYVITPEQQTALKEATDRFTMMLRRQQAEGVKIREWQEGYWHRIVTKRPTAEPGRIGVGAGRLGARPSAARMRVFGDVEDAWRRGYRYANDIEAMMAYGQDAAAAVADRNTVRVVQNLGFKPSEKVDPAIIQELTDARQGYKATRAAASKKGATTAERASALEADVRLDNAMRAMRLESRRWAERQPKVFGRIVSPEVAQEFTRYVGDLPEGTIDQVFQLLRANMIWGDLSAAGVQTQSLIWRDTVTWLKATAYSVRAMASEPTSYILKNVDSLESGVRSGAVRAPDEYLLRMGKGLAHRFGQLPGVKQTQRAFEWDILVAQNERWKAVQRMAKTPDDLLELAAEIRAQTGTALMPGLTRAQAKWMGRTWFAGRFLTSTLAVFKNATRTGVAGHEARRTLLQIFGGVAATTAAANIALTGKPGNFTDPDKPGFLGVRLGEGFVYLYGPFHPLLVATARTSRAAAMLAQGEKPSNRDLQAMPRLIEGKLSLPYRVTTQALEALGVPLEAIRGEPYESPKIVGVGGWLRQLGEYVPIGPSQAVQGIKQGFYAAALEPLGAKTTPISPWAKLNELVPGWDKLTDPERKVKAAENPEVRKWWDKHTRQAAGRGKEWAVFKEEQQKQDADAEKQLLALRDNPQATYADVYGNYSNYLQKRAVLSQDEYEGKEFDPRSDLDRRMDVYYAAGPTDFMTGVDRDAAYDAQDAILEGDPDLKQNILSGRILRWPSAEMQAMATEMENAKDVRKQLYAIPAKVGMSAGDQADLKPYLAQLYAYQQMGMDQEQAIFTKIKPPKNLLHRLLVYLELPSNPARRAFKAAHLDALSWFEDIPYEDISEEEEPALELAGVR